MKWNLNLKRKSNELLNPQGRISGPPSEYGDLSRSTGLPRRVGNQRVSNQTGSIMVGLVFMVGTFSIVIYALLLVIGSQFDFTFRQVAFDQSLNIAEAGINYYRWHLAHDATDYTDGTGETGPYVHAYIDPQGQEVGEFSLEITPPEFGSSIMTIASTGTTNDFPGIKRTVTAQFGPQSLASFAFMSDSALWFGTGTTLGGEIHSNNGIRMDGVNLSRLRSSKETYTCGIETGCWPNAEEKPGIWGGGGPKELWEFPVPAIDFGSFNVDFGRMRSVAQTEGIYLGESQAGGYHLIFNSDGTVTINKVVAVSNKRGYTPEDDCQNLYQVIVNEEFIETRSLSGIPVLYAEDILWVEGVVKGKLTVAAGRFPLNSFETNIWINGNLVYADKDDTNKLGLVAQHDIYFVLDVPQEFEVNAAMVAQNGKVVRHHYNWFQCSSYSQAQRNRITIYGAITSKEKSYWNFGSGPNQPASGFVKREIVYDQGFIYEPPPYFPTTGDIQLISWSED